MARRQIAFRSALSFSLAAGLLTSIVSGKTKPKPEPSPRDQIDVIANLPVPGGRVLHLTPSRHLDRSYLYLEQSSHVVTLVDVTDAQHPAIVGRVDLPAAGSPTILTAAGETALISSSSARTSPATSEDTTMTIVSFADRAHPQTVREFHKVTGTALDDRRGLVFVASEEGLWILHRNPAEDPQLQEQYAHQVLYNQ